MLALLRLHRIDEDPAWVDAAELAASYLIDERDAELPTAKLPHDHWLLYALNELHGFRPKDKYLNHAMRITEAIVKAQNRGPEPPDWIGSFYRPPRSTPTACRSEGLLAAHALATRTGKRVEARDAIDATRRALGFQFATQCTPERAMFFERPTRALGGFHLSLYEFEIRIDYVQHNVSALLAMLRVLEGAAEDEKAAEETTRGE